MTDAELREKAQAIITEFLADDLAYFRFGNSFKNLTPEQAASMLFATTDLAKKIVSRDAAKEREVRIDELKRVKENSEQSYLGEDWFTDENINDSTAQMVPLSYFERRESDLVRSKKTLWHECPHCGATCKADETMKHQTGCVDEGMF